MNDLCGKMNKIICEERGGGIFLAPRIPRTCCIVYDSLTFYFKVIVIIRDNVY